MLHSFTVVLLLWILYPELGFKLHYRFVASARQLAKALEVPLVNDLGYTKRYVRCLQVCPFVAALYSNWSMNKILILTGNNNFFCSFFAWSDAMILLFYFCGIEGDWLCFPILIPYE